MRGQQQQSSNSLDFLYIVIIFVVGILFAWWKASDAILHCIYVIREYEMALVYYVMEFIKLHTGDWLISKSVMQGIMDEYSKLTAFVELGDYNQLTYQDMLLDSETVGKYLAYPNLVWGALCIYLVFQSKIAYKYRRRYNMGTLRKAEMVNWPQIHVVCSMNLVKQDIDEGPWAMSYQPLIFAHKKDLLERTIKEHKPAVKLRRNAAQREFALQMGPLWQGLHELPVYTQALFAIFAARGEEDTESADKLMEHIQLAAGRGKISFGNYQEVLAKHVKSKKIGRILGPHAYVLTAMASMLDYARSTGVFACSEFLWLKPIDRRLWFMLNNVGRQTAFVDCAGPYAHWLMERRLRRPLKVPMVEMAVDALDEAIEEVLYNPDEDEI